MAGAKDVVTRACEVTRSCKGADALIRGIPGSWIRNDARRGYALVAVPDHHLTRGQCMRMDWKIREIVKGLPKSYHRWLLGDPWPCAEAHPDHYGDTMRLNASRRYSLGLAFIAVSRLASLAAESHIDLLKVLGQE